MESVMAGLVLMRANVVRSFNVTPAQAGVQRRSSAQVAERLVPRLRGDDSVAMSYYRLSALTACSAAATPVR